MALDALRRATSGDPDSLEAGEALALERRVVRARRALERAVAVLSEGTGAGVTPSTTAPEPAARCACSWPPGPTRRRGSA